MTEQHFGVTLSSGKNLGLHLFKVLTIGFSLALVSFFTADAYLAQTFNLEENLTYRRFFRAITDIGLSSHYFILAIGLFIFGRFIAPHIAALKPFQSKYVYARKWGLNLLTALVVSGIFIHLFKFLFGRQRPHKSETLDHMVFDPINTHWHWHSFPSGHSQVMFTVATMFCVAFPRLSWLWCSFAALLCFSRVAVLDHFLSDTIFGACVGYAGTLLALYLMKKKTQNVLF